MARKIRQALASGAIATRAQRKATDRTECPAEEWTPPTSEPISKTFMAMEKKFNEEIMAESWQVACGQNEPEDDKDDGLAEEEAHLERVSNLNDVTDNTIRKGILNGTIPSAAYDTAATSNC